MFVDIVGSTEHATRRGDRQWRNLLFAVPTDMKQADI
jgi:class 3 adenylate cyclase